MKKLSFMMLSFLLLSISCSKEDNCTFEINGVVLDAQTQQPIVGAKVFAEGSTREGRLGGSSYYPLDTMRTDANGEFRLISENSADQWRLLVGGAHYLYDEQYLSSQGCSDFDHSVSIVPLAKVTIKTFDDLNVEYDSIKISSLSNQLSFWDIMEERDRATLRPGQEKTIYVPGEPQGELRIFYYAGGVSNIVDIIHDAKVPGDEIVLEVGL